MCRLSKEIHRGGSKSEVIPSFTLAGQLASFIDKSENGLGLSLEEALDGVPYELLLLMQRDKARITPDDAEVEVDDSYFFKSNGIVRG